MDAIPALPPSAAPVTDNTAPTRDAKGCDSDPKGFEDALKQGLAARSGESKETARDGNAADEPTTEKDDETAVDQPRAIDPSVAALLGETTPQPPAIVALPASVAAAQTIVPADRAASGETDTGTADAISDSARRGPFDPTATHRAAELAAKSGRAALERSSTGGAEHVAVDRALDRAAQERSVVDRASGERSPAERPFDVRELKLSRDAGDRLFGSSDRTTTDGVPGLTGGFTVDRGATAADAPVPVSASAATLDSLSASALGGRWGASIVAGGPEAAAAPVTARVDTPLGSAGWGDAFQQKVVWMVDRQLESAEIHVNPPNLGPIDVMLSLTGDGAQIAFASPHAAVREAIEASLPELREALDQRGLSLGQATVGADSGAAREQFAEHAREAAKSNQHGRAGAPTLAVEAPTPARAAIARRGLVDTFA